MNKLISRSLIILLSTTCATTAIDAKEIGQKSSYPSKAVRAKSTSSVLSEKEALELVRNRPEVKDFFANVTKAKIAKAVVEVDRKEGACYVVHVYELVPDGPDSSHTATMNWYNVNFKTKKVTQEF